MSEKPTTISGGCLCEKVRYTITFPSDYDFTNQCSTCQCEQCRKQTGSLVFRVQKIPTSALKYTADSTLSKYQASKESSRGFCSNCGSFLFWHRDGTDRISMCVGCFDKDALSKYGHALTYSEKHLFCDREIEGVTDHLPGNRYKYDDEEGEIVLLPKREAKKA